MGQNTCFACLFPRCAEKSFVAARKIGNVFQPNVLSKQIFQQVHSFQGGNKPRLRVFGDEEFVPLVVSTRVVSLPAGNSGRKRGVNHEDRLCESAPADNPKSSSLDYWAELKLRRSAML